MRDTIQMTTNLPAVQDEKSQTDLTLRQLLADVLGLAPEQVAEFDEETGLFGHLPELDSMAVAGLLTEMEDRLDIIVEDDEVDGEMLETYGGLLAFVLAKNPEAAEQETTEENTEESASDEGTDVTLDEPTGD